MNERIEPQPIQESDPNSKRKRQNSEYQPLHAAPDPVVDSEERKYTRKRRKMSLKEKLVVIGTSVVAVALCVVMVLNMKLFPYEVTDDNGHTHTTRISLMQKFRNWTPFLPEGGELNSKEYSFQVKSEADPNLQSNLESKFDDGLDLNQIQEGQFSILFLGLDELRANTDVMMLAMFDIAANTINILQIPRDTFVGDFTTFEGGKLNSVYSMGSSEESHVQRVVDCVEELFHVPIDRYIITSCSDIVDIVDLIGGVPIDMPYTIKYEPGKTIYKGQQTLTGQQAEWMVRYRYGYNEGDIGRMKAQRIFLAALMEKVCDIGTIELMGYADTMVEEEMLFSNLSMDEISKLSDFAMTVGMDKITMFMLPGEGYNYYPENWQYYDHYSVWSIHYEPTVNLLNKYFRPYYEPIYELPIEELVTEENYAYTIYDDETVSFEEINEGDTFMGN